MNVVIQQNTMEEQQAQSIKLSQSELADVVKQAVREEVNHEGLVLQSPSGARIEISSGSKTLKQLITIGFNSIERLNKSSKNKTKMPGIQ